MSNTLQVTSAVNPILENIRATAPVLSARIMLVMLNISCWEGRKMDNRVSTQIAKENNADDGVFSAYKSLLGKNCADLAAIKELRGHARNHIHYYYTQPWSDSGLRMLTTKAYFEYHPLITDAQNTFYMLVDDFMSRYPNYVAQAQYALGDSYMPEEYPSEEELRSKFRFEVSYIPMPESGDFRLDVEKEVLDHLATGYSKFYDAQFNGAMMEVWEKLREPLANMVEKLDYAGDDDKKRFKGTLVDNVLNIVDLMELVNVHGDTHMAAVQQKLRSALQGVTVEGLKDDDSLRRNVQREAADALRATQQAIANLPSIF